MTHGESWRGAVERVRRAASAKGRARSGYFSLEGTRLHERALRAGTPLVQAVVGERFAADPQPRIRALLAALAAADCPVVRIPDAAMATLTAGRGLGDIVGLAPLPAQPTLTELLAQAESGPALFLVALDVVDPGNVGALLRTAHALGATAFISVGVSDPWHPKAVRTSMGSLFKLPVRRYDAVDALLSDLRDCTVETVAAAAGEGEPLPGVTFGGRDAAVFVGNEAFGLPAPVVAQMDRRLFVPMHPGVDSLSVNAAAAIVLYEVQRARWLQMPAHGRD